NDPRNQLLIKYFEFVRQIRPKFFLVENVPGLIWSRNKDYLQAFYSIATESGYKVLNPEILNAMNFGIPQSRKRVFILGIRGDLNIDTLFWPPKPTYGNGLKELVPSSIAFTETWDGDPNDIHSVHTEEIISAFKNTPINGGSRMESGRQLKCHIGHKGHSDVYGRIDPSKPAPTMTAGCTSPSKGRFVHPTEPHGITLRQAARLQTFPDDFIFYGGMTSSTRQIGNAVPVLMAESVLRPIYDILVSIDLEKLKMEDAA
ncbi:MAG TPA: DNA (cytosine-5-)-methyltransferase, partial [Chryseobacterium sp.]|nr:DNA (cytosine-5-)-methyltransferase [Chryseobacterium sp.]